MWRRKRKRSWGGGIEERGKKEGYKDDVDEKKEKVKDI